MAKSIIKRTRLYSQLGTQLLGASWVSITFVTSLPLGMALTKLGTLLINFESKWHLVLSIILLTGMCSVSIGLPLWGWFKYCQTVKTFGVHEAHRFIRWFLKGNDNSFEFVEKL